MAWHSDNSFDVQPPGISFLYALEVPAEGGDTVFADMETAYERLSPGFQKTLDALEAVHTSRDQTARAVAGGGYVRREPIDTVHPIVRTNLVTGKKALFVNPLYTRQIVGFKKEESDHLLKFLYNHITMSHDLQCRVRWENRTVVVFDVSLHQSQYLRETANAFHRTATLATQASQTGWMAGDGTLLGKIHFHGKSRLASLMNNIS